MSPSQGREVGRPRGFDRNALLLRVADLFDRFGYEGLSVSDLAAELGVSHTSLYAAFGPKPLLFRKALDAYAEAWASAARNSLSVAGLEPALLSFFNSQATTFCAGSRQAGCMLSAALQTSAAGHAAEARHAVRRRASMVMVVRARLEQAARSGDLPMSCDRDRLATFICGLLHGMSTLARDGADIELVSGFARFALAGLLTSFSPAQTQIPAVRESQLADPDDRRRESLD